LSWLRKATPINFLAALLLLVCAAECYAGPPFFTDDPEPVELHHWEAYLASQYIQTSADRSGTAPHIEVNYGAYPNLQLHVIAPAAFDRPAGGPAAYGYGDTELGAKYRFISETNDRPQVGTFVLVEAPTGDAERNLGNGSAQIFIPIWLQKSWGPWTSYGGGGYWINPGAGQRNGGFIGWLLRRDVSKALTLGAEIFHREIETVNGPTGTGFTAGGQLNFGGHYHLLFSAGKDISGPEQLTRYAAFQWTF
jgi:hypothetical protein